MNRREMIALLIVLGIAGVVIGVYPTTPRGDVPAPRVADWSKVQDDPNQKLELVWAGPPSAPSAKKGTWVEKYLERIFNVRFQPIFLDWNSYVTRRPLMFSGGEVPDVVWDGDPMPLRRSIKHGLVLEIPYEVILKHAPTYVKYQNQYGPKAWLYSNYRGRNYGIPTWGAGGYTHCALWRMDYLRKVGIEKVPETMEEIHDAFVKLRDGDPAGTGRGTVYGMCPLMHWSMTFLDIFAPYNNLPGDFMLRDGKIVWGGVQPEARQVLELLKQWYAEGLIDPDFISATEGADLSEERFLNGKTAYLYQYKGYNDMDLTNPNSFYSKIKQLHPEAEVVLAAPLKGPDGKRRDRVWKGGAHIMWFGPQVKDHPEKVIRVLKMFEALAKDKDLYIESHLGRRGEHWDYSPERGIYMLPPYDAPGADIRNLIDARGLTNCFGFYACPGAPPEFTDPLMRAGLQEIRMRYSDPQWGISNPLGKSDVVESTAEFLQDLRQYQMTTYIQFIRGDRPLSEFDAFVEEWNRRGGERMTIEANEMYKEMKRIAKIVGIENTGDDQ